MALATMLPSHLAEHAHAAIERQFGDPSRLVSLKPGGVLLREGEPNRRLYCVRAGEVSGSVLLPNGAVDEVMRAGEGDLVGVQSFFTGTHESAMTVTATLPTTLGYIERDWRPPAADAPVEQQLMPVVIAELVRRQRQLAEQAREEQEVLSRIQRMERYSKLGQLAAGVAHELNNAVAVLARGTEWVADAVREEVARETKLLRQAFAVGLADGRSVSSSEARLRARQLSKRFKLGDAQARAMAQTGLGDDVLDRFRDLRDDADDVQRLWELGATLHDMSNAAAQAEHVVESMRNLGAKAADRRAPEDVNETIDVALKILGSLTRQVDVELDLSPLPPLVANRGELVQIWSNLIKNACEAMQARGSIEKKLRIISRNGDGEIMVAIEDTGPGIPDHLLDQIFQPSVTTKKSGLTFGLGLGLAIVRRLVTDYGGDVIVANTGRGARFTVTLPAGPTPVHLSGEPSDG